jgi:SAM-dependent methyltransferase
VIEARKEAAAEGLRVLVPGAGRAHDARAWARAGHRVTAVDFAPLAIEEARVLAEAEGVQVEFVRADVSALPTDWTGRFDVVWEQTCLCAIPPDLRKPYLAEVERVLEPSGRLIAVLWNHGKAEGPPYDMDVDTVMDALDGRFEVLERELVGDSPGDRVGEWLWTLALKG